MPHSAASDLGLHCLPMSFLWDTRHKWGNFVSEPYIILWGEEKPVKMNGCKGRRRPWKWVKENRKKPCFTHPGWEFFCQYMETDLVSIEPVEHNPNIALQIFSEIFKNLCSQYSRYKWNIIGLSEITWRNSPKQRNFWRWTLVYMSLIVGQTQVWCKMSGMPRHF